MTGPINKTKSRKAAAASLMSRTGQINIAESRRGAAAAPRLILKRLVNKPKPTRTTPSRSDVLVVQRSPQGFIEGLTQPRPTKRKQGRPAKPERQKASDENLKREESCVCLISLQEKVSTVAIAKCLVSVAAADVHVGQMDSVDRVPDSEDEQIQLTGQSSYVSVLSQTGDPKKQQLCIRLDYRLPPGRSDLRVLRVGQRQAGSETLPAGGPQSYGKSSSTCDSP